MSHNNFRCMSISLDLVVIELSMTLWMCVESNQSHKIKSEIFGVDVEYYWPKLKAFWILT